MGPAVAAYTGALICDTAVPAWHYGYPQMPFVFVGSAAAAAGGLGMLTVPVDEAKPARRAGFAGALLEVAATRRMRQRLGPVGEPMRHGTAGRLLQAGELLTGGGGLLGLLLGRRSRVAAALSGAALLAGSACTRFGIFRAGVASATDPKYTVEPQRDRLDRASEGVAR